MPEKTSITPSFRQPDAVLAESNGLPVQLESPAHVNMAVGVSGLTCLTIEQNESAHASQIVDPIITELLDEYRMQLPFRLSMLAGLIPQAVRGSKEAVRSMIAEVHKLRGTARIFGFPTIGVAMAEMEDILVNAPDEHLAGHEPSAGVRLYITLDIAHAEICD